MIPSFIFPNDGKTQYSPNRTGHLNIDIHSACGRIHKIWASSTQTKPQHAEGAMKMNINSSPPRELLATDSHCRKGGSIFLELVAHIHCVICSSKWPYSQEGLVVSVNWSRWVLIKWGQKLYWMLDDGVDVWKSWFWEVNLMFTKKSTTHLVPLRAYFMPPPSHRGKLESHVCRKHRFCFCLT